MTDKDKRIEELEETGADDRLKPCPFCGDLARVEAHGMGRGWGTGPGYRVECQGRCHGMTCYWHTEHEAICYWNGRAPSLLSDKPEPSERTPEQEAAFDQLLKDDGELYDVTEPEPVGDVERVAQSVYEHFEFGRWLGDYEKKPAWVTGGNSNMQQLARAFATAALSAIRPSVDERTQAAKDVLAERDRQKSAEGWTPEHDDTHGDGELARAAAAYAYIGGAKERVREVVFPDAPPYDSRRMVVIQRCWPWDWSWWKPKDRRRDLVRAGALILAEIERLDRLSLIGGSHD